VSVAGPAVTRLRATDRHGRGRLRRFGKGGKRISRGPQGAAISRPSSSTATRTTSCTAGGSLYRGYPIEQLAENSTYLEVAYLVL